MPIINEYFHILPEEIAISADTNDLPVQSSYIHITPSAAYNLTGIQPPVDYDHSARLVIENESGTFNLTLKANDTNSAVGNRFIMASDVVLTPGQYAFFIKVANGFILDFVY